MAPATAPPRNSLQVMALIRQHQRAIRRHERAILKLEAELNGIPYDDDDVDDEDDVEDYDYDDAVVHG